MSGDAFAGPGDVAHAVRRHQDGELEGFVRTLGAAGWEALTVFGGRLGTCSTRPAAEALVHRRGLAALAERWHWRSRLTGDWRVVLPQEARPGWVRVAVGWYSLPGVETAVITAEDLAAGDILTLEQPADAGFEAIPG